MKNKTKLSLTDKKLIEMMCENTGAHFLDSGGAYGRNYDRNRTRKFMEEPTVRIDCPSKNFPKSGFMFSVNGFHYLQGILKYDSYLTGKFNRFCNLPENKEENWYELRYEFLKKFEGISKSSEPINSYNYESSLDMVILFQTFEYDKKDYVILQTHNGCDVRGGYSKPKIFENQDYDSMGYLNTNPDYFLSCECGMFWDTTYNGSTLHFDNNGYNGKPKNIPTDFPNEFDDLEVTFDEDEKGTGKLYVNDNKVYCPICDCELHA